MKLTVLGGALALLFTLAAPAGAQETPQWLKEARARESTLAEPKAVVSEDGWLRTKVPGEVKQRPVLEGGGYSVGIDLGGTTVLCEVMRGARDLAAFLTQTAALSFEEIEKLNGTVEARVLEASDAGSVGPHPFLSLQWLYRANRKGEVRVGALKQYIVSLDDAVIYCAHDDLGYVKSFDAVTRAMTTHFESSDAPLPQPYFREVSVVSMDGTKVGVAATTMTRDADGDTQVVTRSALLLQRAPGQLVSQDVSDVQWVRPDGSLINAVQAKGSDGQLSEEMSLRLDDERWRARGTIQGKPIDVVLPAAPSSYVLLARARKQLMAQAEPLGTATEGMTWSSLDLTRLLPTRATVLAPAGADGFAVREEIGGVAIQAVLDKQTGTMISARIPVGPRSLNFERIVKQGEF
jgi:hypothetical protein